MQKVGKRTFLDFESLKGRTGQFPQKLYENVRNSKNFVILLSPYTLRYCPHNDWMTKELNEALRSRINIIPVWVEPFQFTEKNRQRLFGPWKRIPTMQAVRWGGGHHEEAMEELLQALV